MTELEYSEFLKSETDLEREADILSLEHYGIKGMKWGVRRTPEQLGHKTKKGPGLVSKIRDSQKRRKKKAQQAKANKAKAAAKRQEESTEEIRKKVLASTDPEYIYKHRALMTSQELQERIDRISKEERIKSLIKDPDAKRKATIKKGEETLKSLASMADSVGKIYDTYNKISGGSSKGGGGGNQQKQQKQNKQDQQSQGGGKRGKPQKQSDSSSNSEDKTNEEERTKTKSEQKKEKRDRERTMKAAQQFMKDPAVQTFMAIGMGYTNDWDRGKKNR